MFWIKVGISHRVQAIEPWFLKGLKLNIKHLVQTQPCMYIGLRTASEERSLEKYM